MHINVSKCLTYLFLAGSNFYLCKQFLPRLELTECLPWSGFKLFDTLIVFLMFLKSADDNKSIKYTACKESKCFVLMLIRLVFCDVL